MARTRGQIKETLRGIINRGATVDGVLDFYLASAGQWIERNYTLQYMHRWVEFTLDPLAPHPRMMPLPERPKSIEFIRLKQGTDYAYVRRVHAQEIEGEYIGFPTHYWLDADQHIVLSAAPAEAIDGEMGYHIYSDWNGQTDDSEHWLFDYGSDLIVHQTLLLMIPYIRWEDRFQTLQATRDEALRTLLLADEELKNGPTAETRMNYVHRY